MAWLTIGDETSKGLDSNEILCFTAFLYQLKEPW